MNQTETASSKGVMSSSRAWLAGLLTLALVGTTAATAAALSRGSRAPDIGLRDTRGRMVRLADLRDKVVLVDFWASWCAPCREEMPVLERLHQRYKDHGLVIIGVNIDQDEPNMNGFLRRTPVSFRIVHDGDREVAGRYDPPRMPSSYIIKNGVVRHVHEGFRARDAQVFEREIRELLGN